MSDILLLEPNYSNKYPPIGLMKISYFHKYIHHDYVRFAKGELPEAFRDKKWDRVYVTTLNMHCLWLKIPRKFIRVVFLQR